MTRNSFGSRGLVRRQLGTGHLMEGKIKISKDNLERSEG